MSTMLAENYQLKWHSHGVNLHSSIATLHRSESFSDVTLATADGRYVSAHRFILSACSSYLHQLFQVMGSRGGNTSLIVVLPSDISYRTLGILLQYMYSGEATVSNEQLNGVLKAGEILRIKGLCHSHNNSAMTNAKEKERSMMMHSGRTTGVLTQQNNQNDEGQHKKEKITAEDKPEKNPEKHSPDEKSKSEANAPPAKKAAYSILKSMNKQQAEVKIEKDKESSKQNEDAEQNENQKENNASDKSGSASEQMSQISIEDVTGIEQNMQIELLVKEEPIEWEDIEESQGDDESMLHSEMTIKSEVYSGEEEEDLNEFYAPLTCDMCQETFTTPALWVRHTETHPPTDLPRRRGKRNATDDDSGEFPPLRCELCQEVYTNPGDWVRHIQSAHTEEQLAMSNNSKYTPRPVARRHRIMNGRKHCPLCEKTFPSHASMLVHSRTHTGERPYECSICAKEFNVKSNLLRHMRTLHDEIINPGNIQPYPSNV